jgi:hypothetical protein
MTKLSDLGPPIIGTKHAEQVEHESDHFYPCPTCGQAVDVRDLRQVAYHNGPDHEPLEPDA